MTAATNTSVPLPATVTVGPYEYTVTTDELTRRRVEGDERTLLNGHTDHDQLRIVIDPQYAVGTVRDTVLHEVLHTVAYLTGLSHEWGDKEEAVVRRLSPALLDVLRRNPTLVTYLTAP